METYLSFVIIACFCTFVVTIFIIAMSDYDFEKKPSYKTHTIPVIIAMVVVGSTGYFNYARSQAIQRKIIKECYYKGVSMRINKTFKTTSDGKLIESKADSVFYIK